MAFFFFFSYNDRDLKNGLFCAREGGPKPPPSQSIALAS